MYQLNRNEGGSIENPLKSVNAENDNKNDGKPIEEEVFPEDEKKRYLYLKSMLEVDEERFESRPGEGFALTKEIDGEDYMFEIVYYKERRGKEGGSVVTIDYKLAKDPGFYTSTNKGMATFNKIAGTIVGLIAYIRREEDSRLNQVIIEAAKTGLNTEGLEKVSIMLKDFIDNKQDLANGFEYCPEDGEMDIEIIDNEVIVEDQYGNIILKKTPRFISKRQGNKGKINKR